MNYSVKFSGKNVAVSLTRAAQRALLKCEKAITVEMELYFSCLIRKRVIFREADDQQTGQAVGENLFIQFRPVMTRHCGKEYEGDEPPLTDFPIEDPAPFVPKWLTIDYHRGQWRGEFGY